MILTAGLDGAAEPRCSPNVGSATALSLDQAACTASGNRVLGVVRMADGLPQPAVELVAPDDLLRVDGDDGAERNGEIAGILDADDELRQPARRLPAHGMIAISSVMKVLMAPR